MNKKNQPGDKDPVNDEQPTDAPSSETPLGGTPLGGTPETAAREIPDNAPENSRSPWLEGAADKILALQEEISALKDKLLLGVADMENLRRRTEREKQDARKYAVTNFAQDLLAIGDNLTRAMKSLEAAKDDPAEDIVKTLVDGIEMTEREMLNVFSRHGISKIDPQGEKFDPNQHQAIFEIDNADVPAGTVLEIIQAGYSIGERILRPAMVGVSKGGAKAGPAVETPEDNVEPEPAPNPATPKDPANLGKKIDKSA